MLTIVQLARAGDILSIIPAIDHLRKGERVNWLVHEYYANTLDKLSWVEKHIWRGGDSAVKEAVWHAEKHIGGTIIATQVNGNPVERSQPNFILDQWHRAGVMDRFHALPLNFDIPFNMPAVAPQASKPLIGYSFEGHSSPYRNSFAMKQLLTRVAGDAGFELLDLGAMKLASVVDVLPILKQCDLLVTIDSALLHLSYASLTPTIAFSKPLEWYASEPRIHWVERFHYDESLRRIEKRLVELLKMPRADLLNLRGSLIRHYEPPDMSRPIVQIVDWFEGSGEMARRHNFARSTWAPAERPNYKLILRQPAPGDRSSKDIGDNRQLPYLKDVINTAVNSIPKDAPDIICLTNADTCLFVETHDAIRRAMNGKPCICSGRVDIPRADRPLKMAEVNGMAVYVGTDLFCFTRAWWERMRDDIPDMLIACEGWDFVLYKMMERTISTARVPYALCYHERHAAFWTQHLQNNPGQEHNRRLGRAWAEKFGFTEFLDSGPFLFRSTPRNGDVLSRAPDMPEEAVIVSGDTSVTTDREFARLTEVVVKNTKPARILETGTYHGTGTTRIVLDSLRKHGLKAEFVSIECDADCVDQAKANLAGEPVRLVHAISIPRDKLPSEAEIEALYVRGKPRVKWIDHLEAERAATYYGETNKPDVDDDAIGRILDGWAGNCDLVILDSAGHIGKLEFDYLLTKLRSTCIIILDDVHHIKHARSLEMCRQDRRFDIVAESGERCGFAVIEYTPRPSGRLMPRLRRCV